jgi:hypothetical protein
MEVRDAFKELEEKTEEEYLETKHRNLQSWVMISI